MAIPMMADSLASATGSSSSTCCERSSKSGARRANESFCTKLSFASIQTSATSASVAASAKAGYVSWPSGTVPQPTTGACNGMHSWHPLQIHAAAVRGARGDAGGKAERRAARRVRRVVEVARFGDLTQHAAGRKRRQAGIAAAVATGAGAAHRCLQERTRGKLPLPHRRWLPSPRRRFRRTRRHRSGCHPEAGHRVARRQSDAEAPVPPPRPPTATEPGPPDAPPIELAATAGDRDRDQHTAEPRQDALHCRLPHTQEVFHALSRGSAALATAGAAQIATFVSRAPHARRTRYVQ